MQASGIINVTATGRISVTATRINVTVTRINVTARKNVNVTTLTSISSSNTSSEKAASSEEIVTGWATGDNQVGMIK